ncbi:N-acetylmannosamine-6-phosphate 2-epimerase [Agromyces sp. SYSU K20354]|uniref:N-acetylmannosamine-6-phosphate 2-epimerase n=1 Tax=Agromyces cavernae TaxID=2898659 RepID=UPI001E5F5ED1|nr:N-acetylmannosamine-6-phosphate 2-epimerase [Agromyces cavernae]MCD2441249.1 N-acetylmannosamine-6-phosphate 2-epimerase [Agromyces cavernae]
MNVEPSDLTARLRGGLIVSCQAYPGEPMRDPNTMAQVARAAVDGGAVGIRLQGIGDIRAAADLEVPVIGLWKDGADGVFITPTLEHARAVADAGADVVALDGTRRPRPDGLTLAETIAALRETHDVLVMADCGSLDDAIAAEAAGADLLGTTLAGYTGERPKTDGPDLELVAQVAARCERPIIAEGRIHTPDAAAAAIEAGATAVCVGTAITHPSSITSWFVAALDARPDASQEDSA